jgi:hypothetical protein
MSARTIDFKADPSDEELLRDWTLNAQDKAEIRACNGQAQRYQFALQLCVLRRYGYFMASEQTSVPVRIVNHLGAQLGYAPTLFLPRVEREATVLAHRKRLRRYLEYQGFGPQERTQLQGWLREQRRLDLDSSELCDLATEYLQRNRILVPSESTLQRIVGSEVARSERSSFGGIARHIPVHVKSRLDAALLVDSALNISTLQWLGQFPPEATPATILEYVERLDWLRTSGISEVPLHDVRPSALSYCYRLASRLNAFRLRRTRPEKRYALVFSHLLKTQSMLLDRLVEMHRSYLTTMNRRARRAAEARLKEEQDNTRAGVALMLDAMSVIVDDEVPMESRASLVHERFGTEQLLAALEACRMNSRSRDDAYFDAMRSRHPWLKRYFPAFLTLPFQAETGSEGLLRAIDFARSSFAGELAGEAPTEFVSGRWRTAILRNGVLDRSLWEVALAFAIRDGLRSGDLYLAQSAQHVSFWKLAYSREYWAEERDRAYAQLRVPQDSNHAVEELCLAHHMEASELARGLARNSFVRVYPLLALAMQRRALIRTS